MTVDVQDPKGQMVKLFPKVDTIRAQQITILAQQDIILAQQDTTLACMDS